MDTRYGCTLAIVVILGILASVSAAPIRLYVSPDGRDAWSGGQPQALADGTDGPLRSVQAALDRSRILRAAGATESLEIVLRGGLYELPAPLHFTPADSHMALMAYPGEAPVLSGGTPLSGWTNVRGTLWQAPVPRNAAGQPIHFNQLFINGERRTLARTPNAVPAGPDTPRASTEGYFTVAGKPPIQRDPVTGRQVDLEHQVFVYEPGSIKPWTNLNDVRIVLYDSWETSRRPIKELDEESGTVTLAGRFVWDISYFGTAQRYFVENAPDALDAPGEWYLDTQAGVVRYLAFPGEDPSHSAVVVPRLNCLVTVAGDAGLGLWVEDLRFSGLSFQYEDWVLEASGHGDGQAVDTAPAAIMLDGARNVTFERCDIAHVGDYALWLRRACKGNVVRQCRVHDLGTGGVRIGVTSTPGSDAETSSDNIVDNCHIFDGNHVYAGGVGLFIAQAFGNQITHNEIHSLTYSGISVGWTWGDNYTRCRDNMFEYNHIHHVMNRTLNDGGGIYTLGNSPGSVIRGNVVHDVWPWCDYGWGIYLDATTNGFLVENNLVYYTYSGGLMGSNGTHENVIRNNVFALFSLQALRPYWEKRPNTFTKNVVYTTQGQLVWPGSEAFQKERLAAGESLGQWDENCYWDTRLDASETPGDDAFELLFYDKTWTEWRDLGLDQQSVIADPLFNDVAGLDFTLRPESPALKLGFEPLNPDRAGLYGDPQWVAEARTITFPKTVLRPPPAPPARVTVNDDFEQTTVNAYPRLAHVSGDSQGARIGVTKAVAASGQHSLEVLDAEELTPDWQPHFFYEPRFAKGDVQQSFDIRVGPGALLYTEWRDDGTYPDKIGPSVTIDATGDTGSARLVVAGRTLTTVPIETWVHLELESRLGRDNPKTWTLSVQPAGLPRQRFEALPHGGNAFTKLQWLGFVSTATTDAVFHLDNLHIKPITP